LSEFLRRTDERTWRPDVITALHTQRNRIGSCQPGPRQLSAPEDVPVPRAKLPRRWIVNKYRLMVREQQPFSRIRPRILRFDGAYEPKPHFLGRIPPKFMATISPISRSPGRV